MSADPKVHERTAEPTAFGPGSEQTLKTSKSGILGVSTLGEVLAPLLDQGSRQKSTTGEVSVVPGDQTEREYRVRIPTRSERMNRSLAELGLAAFKIHTLLWQWRGSPARGTLAFFTIHSLAKYCSMTRPTVRVALAELVKKQYIHRLKYNGHYKNTLYKLIGVRKIPPPRGHVPSRRGRRAIEAKDRGRQGTKS